MKSKKSIKSILFMSALGIVSLFFINMSLAANTAKVSVETANLRETTDESSKILEQFSVGQKVEVLEKEGNWYKVKANGVTGYLREDLITLDNEAQDTTTKNETNTTDDEAKQENTTNKQENNITDTKENSVVVGQKYKIAQDTKLKIVPVINARDITEVRANEEVVVTEILNDWLCIEVQNTKGWIRKNRIKIEATENKETETVENNTNSQENTTKTLYVNTETANLRKEANTNSEIVTTLSLNSAVNVISEENGWSKVKISDKEGYISSSLLSNQRQETSRSMTENRNKQDTQSSTTTKKQDTKSTTATNTDIATSVPASGKGSSVVATANQYIGCKYVYGGTSPSGFDCSGFTSYVYKKYGVSLNRTAAGQYSNGVSVSRSQLQPGDLVMFGKSGINHVGIYVGGGNIVHAANSSRGVTTDTINSGYYNKNYVGARRIL